jgi:hypothetical protein
MTPSPNLGALKRFSMRGLIIALVVLPTVAFAANPQQLAENEARGFLRPCKPGGDQQICLINQRNFIEQYVYAKAGDHDGQTSTADSFDTNHLMTKEVLVNYLGMPQNQIESCAWRIVVLQGGHSAPRVEDVAMVHHACGTLDKAQRQSAGGRADDILRSMRTMPVPMPSDDWEPLAAGQKGH